MPSDRDLINELQNLVRRLADLTEPHDIPALRPSPQLQERVRSLLANNRDCGLSGADAAVWKQVEQTEHLVRMAKAQAAIRLNAL